MINFKVTGPCFGSLSPWKRWQKVLLNHACHEASLALNICAWLPSSPPIYSIFPSTSHFFPCWDFAKWSQLKPNIEVRHAFTVRCVHLCVNLWICGIFKCTRVNARMYACAQMSEWTRRVGAPLGAGSMTPWCSTLFMRKHLRWDQDSCGQHIPLRGL